MPQTDPLTNSRYEDLFQYLEFTKKANKCLWIIQNEIKWPFHSGVFVAKLFWSLSWIVYIEKQRADRCAYLPGDDDSESPYLYVNPYPFDEKMGDESLAIGKWHTTGWNGIKVEWKEP
jgi:hypothetical protein